MTAKLILPGGAANLIQIPEKNPMWKDVTPNEVIAVDKKYKFLVRRWAKFNEIKGPYKFQEFRLTSRYSQFNIYSKSWWDDSLFMDKIFWCFYKPVWAEIDGETAAFVALEPYECFRAVAAGEMKYGKNMFGTDRPALILPKDCVTAAWDETSNGYSDHIRHRPEHKDTDKSLEIKAKAKIKVAKALDRGKEIRNSPKWKESFAALEDREQHE